MFYCGVTRRRSTPCVWLLHRLGGVWNLGPHSALDPHLSLLMAFILDSQSIAISATLCDLVTSVLDVLKEAKLVPPLLVHTERQVLCIPPRRGFFLLHYLLVNIKYK